MDDALSVDGGQALGDTGPDLQGQGQRQRPRLLVEERPQVAVGDQLRDQVEDVGVGIVEERVDAEDVRRFGGDAGRVERLVAVPLGVLGAQLDALDGVEQAGLAMAGLEDPRRSRPIPCAGSGRSRRRG